MEIAIVSGKGGTGKSCISAAFASVAGQVVLADCDVDAANQYLLFNPRHEEEHVYVSGHTAQIDYTVCNDCGKCLDHCAFDAITGENGKMVINHILCDGCFLCSRVCPVDAISMIPNDRSRMYAGDFRYGKMAYGRLAPGEENSGRLVQLVREKASELADKSGISTILLDGPPGIGCPVSSTITGADKVVMVTEPTVSGFSDLQRVADMVGNYKMKRYVIINKYDLNPELTKQIADWCREQQITIAGYLPFDEAVVKAMVKQMTVTEFDPGSEISQLLIQAWNTLNLTVES